MSDQTIYGIHAVTTRLQQDATSCVELVCLEGRNPRLASIVELAKKTSLAVRFVKRDAINKLAGSEKHQGCVLLAGESENLTVDFKQALSQTNKDTLWLVLDGLQDPHNLGACLRTADAAGVDFVMIPKDRSVKMNATVRKVAAGAAETVPLIEVTNIARSLRELKQAGIWVYGASGEADTTIYQFDYKGPVALVMGAEGDGLRRLSKQECDHLIKLPMLGSVESLNVSVATGVCLYEVMRSRMACS